jgi:hypothetical protein
MQRSIVAAKPARVRESVRTRVGPFAVSSWISMTRRAGEVPLPLRVDDEISLRPRFYIGTPPRPVLGAIIQGSM